MRFRVDAATQDAVQEEVRLLTNRMVHMGGRGSVDNERVHNPPDVEWVQDSSDNRRSLQAEIRARETAASEAILEEWEATEAGGFRRVALETQRDGDWTDFLREFEATHAVPTTLARHGTWRETQMIGPPIPAGNVLIGPLPPFWQTGGRDPALEVCSPVQCQLQ